eukprot:4683955-Prymnesium_polylepis.1
MRVRGSHARQGRAEGRSDPWHPCEGEGGAQARVLNFGPGISGGRTKKLSGASEGADLRRFRR